ncbi:MAG: YceI family protein [Bacteroidetes bacterium]|nr:YceI family protein [Bacteroidota bacterium]
MKKIFFTLTAIVFSTTIFAQIFMAKSCEVSFFSASPLENIEAINKAAKPLVNAATNDVQIKIVNTAFIFEKPLMQEHFNENYMESEKFPNTIFKGKINEKIDWTKDGEHKVTVTGKMSMHGVDKEITFDGLITMKGGEMTIASKFKVHVADYKIKVPSLYVQNIAEDVDVKINAVLVPYKKN